MQTTAPDLLEDLLGGAGHPWMWMYLYLVVATPVMLVPWEACLVCPSELRMVREGVDPASLHTGDHPRTWIRMVGCEGLLKGISLYLWTLGNRHSNTIMGHGNTLYDIATLLWDMATPYMT